MMKILQNQVMQMGENIGCMRIRHVQMGSGCFHGLVQESLPRGVVLQVGSSTLHALLEGAASSIFLEWRRNPILVESKQYRTMIFEIRFDRCMP